MDLYETHVMSQVVAIIQIGLVATACGWFAERMLGSSSHGWFVPVFSGIAGFFLGPRLVKLVGWHWGPIVADHLVAPIFAGAVLACLFVKLLTLGLAAARH
jgi:uncharacterized membrane protein YeaQ/YmgE (transglycosylase-associated protein family)